MDSAAVKDSSWTDITGEFLSSVKELNLGELLKTDHFTLLEAMSAIELMDPKMDSAMILRGSNRKILSLEQSIKAGTIKTKQLELVEILGIIDNTYSCLVTWLEGNSLLQTVMTNLYLHDPEKIENKCLRLFSQSILRIIDLMDRLVTMVYCIEDEDFVPNNGKSNLANQINEIKLLGSMEELCQQYKGVLENKQTNSNNNKKPQQVDRQIIEADFNLSENDSPLLAALHDRLRFTYNLHACFHNVARHLLHWPIEPQTDVQLQKKSKHIQSSALICDQHLETCLQHLEKWRKTIDMGIKPSSTKTSASGGDYPTIMGFEPLINIKLLPPAYPRCPSMRSRPTTLDYLHDLIIRLRQCIFLSNSFNQKSFFKSLDTIEFFSKYFQPSSCVISRSLMQILYLPNRSIQLLSDELLQSINEFCEPLVQEMKKDEVKFAALNHFLLDCSKSLSQAISLYGHNTARQHERLSDLIVALKNLQYSALLFNGAFNIGIIYSWTTFHLARMCLKYLVSSLELELFSPHEYPYVFWYLYEILYRNERDHIDIAKQFIQQSLLVAEDISKGKLSKGKKLRKKNQFSTTFHDENLRCNDAYRFLSGGLFLLTYGLKLQGKIETPSMEFTSEEICFDRRFGSLTGTSVYHSYRQTVDRLWKLEFIYREAQDCFSEARDLFEAIGGHESCLKVCKTNMVVAKILSTNVDSFRNRELVFSFDTHPSFPTVKF